MHYFILSEAGKLTASTVEIELGFSLFPPLFCFTSGNTLKNIEKECCAKIMIRGKGSVKEGKVGRKDGQMLPGEDEPLHALVTANTMENVKKAVEQVRSPQLF